MVTVGGSSSGTISPWSSKATDIAHNCGLENVLRVERGTAYYIESSELLSEQQLMLVGDLLHDRMVEAVFTDLQQANKLFVRDQPAPLTEVDIIAVLRRLKRRIFPWFSFADDEIDYLVTSFQGLKGIQPTLD